MPDTPEVFTTFKLCREASACTEGYRKLAKFMGGIKKHGQNTPIPLTAVLESNGLDDALWCLSSARAGKDAERVACLFAADCAARVLKFFEHEWPTDTRPRDAISAARRFARGKATEHELAAAWAASGAAAWAASGAAAWAASGAAAWAASGVAARDAAGVAARDAAGVAARDAARAAAWDAERNWQEGQLLKYLNGTAKTVPLPRRK